MREFQEALSITDQCAAFVESRGFKVDRRLSEELGRPIYRDPIRGRYPCELAVAVIEARRPEYAVHIVR